MFSGKSAEDLLQLIHNVLDEIKFDFLITTSVLLDKDKFLSPTPLIIVVMVPTEILIMILL